MTLRLTGLILDCRDPELLASFWTDVLGWQVTFKRGPYVAISRSEAFDDTSWLFQRVPEPKTTNEPKTTKNRWHPDFRVGGRFEDAIKHIEACGGRRVAGYEQGGFFVMADPEGNEFCLIPEGVSIGMDEDGNAHYLDGDLGYLKET
jgi:catechol 2,3-dioxygenase-like lactoylglutathione lyase family enzyme